MWRAINLTKADKGIIFPSIIGFENWYSELQQITNLECKNLLKYFRCERKSETQIILISEMISRGSLSTYLSTFKYPRLTVCQSWFKQILEGLQYLHTQNITHGQLTCDHIYINSNSGELKIGDLCLVKLPDIINNRPTAYSTMNDIHYFGITALEIAFAQVLSHAKLCKLKKRLYGSFDKKYLMKLAKYISDSQYRSLIEACLCTDPGSSVEELLTHQFFTSTRGKNETLKGIVKRIKMEKKLNVIVKENSLKARSAISSPIINILVDITNRTTERIIRFKYNMNYDTPETIAIEMRESLLLPEEYIVAIQSQIKISIQNYINELKKEYTHKRTNTKHQGKLHSYYNVDYTGEGTRPRHPTSRYPSISGSISPIDTCSAASICTNNTIMEQLKVMSGKNIPQCIPKIFSSREDALQPDVAYSDMQLSPRDYCDEEAVIATQKKDNYYKKSQYMEKDWNGYLKKNENMSETEEGDRRNEPII